MALVNSASSSATASDLDEKDYLLDVPSKPKTKRHQHTLNNVDKYQMEIALALLIALLVAHQHPAMSPYTTKFLHLQHRYPGTEYYDAGLDDWCIIVTGMIIATFVRAASMNYVLNPLASYMGIHSQKPVQRFMEQGWYLIYYTTSFAVGTYILCDSECLRDLDKLYTSWPYDQMSALFKGYYLIELACWLQQIFILNIEARRKDHWQMFSHHIITCLLITGSYYYYLTKIGNVILVIMDVVDIFLSTAKLLKYSGFQKTCDVMFGIFVVVWVVLRHGVYNYVLYHAITRSRLLMPAGKCVAGIVVKHCWTDSVMCTFFSLLGGLQIITLVWFYLIVKVVVKVVTGTGAEDVRSDDED